MTSEEIREHLAAIDNGIATHPEWRLSDICEAILRRIEKLEAAQKDIIAAQIVIGSELSQHLNE